MNWHPSKSVVVFFDCYPESVEIQIRIPAISSTTTGYQNKTSLEFGFLSKKHALCGQTYECQLPLTA